MVWITAAEALAILNVRPQTLYANVSRGKIRARADKTDSRRSLYHREDVLHMAKRHNGRRKVATLAAQTIQWGDPVLPSAISTVINERLYYRGQDAVTLSRTATLEDIAALLWDCPRVTIECITPTKRATFQRNRRDEQAVHSVLHGAFMALAERAGHDLPSSGRALPALRIEAGSVLGTLATGLLHTNLSYESKGSKEPNVRGVDAAVVNKTISAQLAIVWNRPVAEDMIRRALVLLADHELNASAFATRVTVSTGASLAAGILSGLASLSGPRHGGAAAALIELIESTQRIGVTLAVKNWLSKGQPLPGFGHPLYPGGDIRAIALMKSLPMNGAWAELQEHVVEAAGEQPNIDFALVMLSRAFDLPPDAPIILFALARGVGWLAHALEQVATHQLIRPRARYTGITPACVAEN